MAVYQKWMSASSQVTTRVTTTGATGGGGSDLGAAAQVIADRAYAIAGAWSVQIPPRIDVSVSGNVATISCDAPPAYPNEVAGVRHPVFGRHTQRWVTNEHRPFLDPAADQGADEAMARYAKKVDAMCRKAGYR